MPRILSVLTLCLVLLGCSENVYEETSIGEYTILTTENHGIGGFGYVHNESLDILVQVLDRNKDGHPDEIIYSSLPSIEKRVRVHDYDFDGQADYRTIGESKSELWYQGGWREVVIRNGNKEIEIEGVSVRVVERDYGRLRVEGI